MSGGQVWLTPGAHRRLRQELAELLRSRSRTAPGAGARDAADPQTAHRTITDKRERETRIRRLQEMLLDPLVGHEPPDDGVAEPGMLLTVRFDDAGETETFLLAQREDGAYPDVETCSPDSPLGRALAGRREGEMCRYPLPGGRSMRATLVRAVPYGEK